MEPLERMEKFYALSETRSRSNSLVIRRRDGDERASAEEAKAAETSDLEAGHADVGHRIVTCSSSLTTTSDEGSEETKYPKHSSRRKEKEPPVTGQIEQELPTTGAFQKLDSKGTLLLPQQTDASTSPSAMEDLAKPIEHQLINSIENGRKRKNKSHLGADAVKKTKFLLRAIAFFYHMAVTVHFTVWTQLILDDFDQNYSKTADFIGICNGVERGIQFLTAPIFGNISDCLGRQPVMLLSLLLHLLALLIVILRQTPHAVLAYFIINGVSNVTWAMLNAISLDLAHGKDELEGGLAQQFGKLYFAVGCGTIVGFLIGPQLQDMHVKYPLYVSMACLFISVLLGYVMSESLPPNAKNPFSLKSSNPFLGFRRALKYRGFLIFSVPFFLSQVAECSYPFLMLYVKKRFDWKYTYFGYYAAALAFLISIVQWNLKRIVPKIITEKQSVLTGFFFHGISMAVLGASVKSWVLALVAPPRMLAGAKTPGLMGFMSRYVLYEDMGVLQGVIMSWRVLAKAIFTPLLGKVFRFYMDPEVISRVGPWAVGMPFYIVASADFVGVILVLIIFSASFQRLFPCDETLDQSSHHPEAELEKVDHMTDKSHQDHHVALNLPSSSVTHMSSSKARDLETFKLQFRQAQKEQQQQAHRRYHSYHRSKVSLEEEEKAATASRKKKAQEEQEEKVRMKRKLIRRASTGSELLRNTTAATTEQRPPQNYHRSKVSLEEEEEKRRMKKSQNPSEKQGQRPRMRRSKTTGGEIREHAPQEGGDEERRKLRRSKSRSGSRPSGSNNYHRSKRALMSATEEETKTNEAVSPIVEEVATAEATTIASSAPPTGGEEATKS